MSIEKAKEFIAALKEMKPDEALKEKATAAVTEEEKLALAADIAHDMGFDVTDADIRDAIAQIKPEDFVALDDDALEDVAGGLPPQVGSKHHLRNRHQHNWEATGNRRPGSFIGLIDDVEFKCTGCGITKWMWSQSIHIDMK